MQWTPTLACMDVYTQEQHRFDLRQHKIKAILRLETLGHSANFVRGHSLPRLCTLMHAQTNLGKQQLRPCFTTCAAASSSRTHI